MGDMLLRALMECAGVPEAIHADALVAVDKLDKIGPDGVAKELEARGVDASATKACLDFFTGASAEESEAPTLALESGARLQATPPFARSDGAIGHPPACADPAIPSAHSAATMHPRDTRIPLRLRPRGLAMRDGRRWRARSLHADARHRRER